MEEINLRANVQLNTSEEAPFKLTHSRSLTDHLPPILIFRRGQPVTVEHS